MMVAADAASHMDGHMQGIGVSLTVIMDGRLYDVWCSSFWKESWTAMQRYHDWWHSGTLGMRMWWTCK